MFRLRYELEQRELLAGLELQSNLVSFLFFLFFVSLLCEFLGFLYSLSFCDWFLGSQTKVLAFLHVSHSEDLLFRCFTWYCFWIRFVFARFLHGYVPLENQNLCGFTRIWFLLFMVFSSIVVMLWCLGHISQKVTMEFVSNKGRECSVYGGSRNWLPLRFGSNSISVVV